MTKQLKIDFSFGVEFQGDGSGIWPEDLAQATIEIKQKALKLFGGYTLFQTSGGWVDKDTGGPVLEVGRCITVYTDDADPAGQWIDEMVACIKSSPLKQKSVSVCITSVTSSIL